MSAESIVVSAFVSINYQKGFGPRTPLVSSDGRRASDSSTRSPALASVRVAASPFRLSRRRGGLRKLGSVLLRNVRQGGVLAQLQRADVGGDRPAIARRDLRPVVRHRAETVGHDVVEMTDRDLAQAVDVVRR